MKRTSKLAWLFLAFAFAVISVGAQEESPKVLKYEKPRSLGAAIATGTQGEVLIDVVVSPEGKVVSAERRSGHPILAGYSKLAAQSWLFSRSSRSTRNATLHFIYRIHQNNDFKKNYKNPTFKYRFRRPYTLETEVTDYPRINY